MPIILAIPLHCEKIPITKYFIIMSEKKLKTTKVEKKVVGAYKTIENGVVKGYQAVEDAVVGTYKKIENKFVDTFLEDKEEPKEE